MLNKLFLLFSLLSSVIAQNATQQQLAHQNRTLSFGVVIFPGYEPLDVYGPLEIMIQLSQTYPITLSIISHKVGPVTSRAPPHRMDPSGPLMEFDSMIGSSTVATHTFENAPELDAILVPGGIGVFALVTTNDTSVEDFVVERFDRAEYILTVCNGATLVARSGLMNGLPATATKSVWNIVTAEGESYKGKGIKWMPSARWVETEKVWSSSGVSAGMDMMAAWTKHFYGGSEVGKMLNGIEYAAHTDPHWDPFSVVHKVPGADTNRSLEDCAGPAAQ
ncbi:class I glutamine amidotransferase-like protein [Polyplosphaeria fusca]|uniref:Class I glutamine amidotransferase-like protein n=1 Tax=Polyplosphaeria fusca TaxID=682080 RepID=A0A9P4QMK2_9PLEO|nr:class I glutamine amidotransferase-like protein [Polyplosphaeria fusca]